MKKRNVFIDVLRGVAIILVCFAHCIQYGSGSGVLQELSFFHNKLYIVIYSFHMPLLMIISGYLFAKSLRRFENIADFLKNRFCTLILPIISWNTIRWIMSILVGKNAFSVEMLTKWIDMLFTEFWFLWAIFWCSLIVYVVYKYLNNSILTYILLFVFFMFIPDAFNAQYYKFMYPFFVVAFKVSERNVLEKINFKLLLGGAGLCGCLWIALLCLWEYDSYIYISGFTILDKGLQQVWIDLYRTIIGGIGSVFIIALVYGVYRLNCKYIARVLAYVGKETMAIYIVSSYINSLVLMRLTASVGEYNYWLILLETVCIILACLCFSFVCRKIPFMAKLFLGGR